MESTLNLIKASKFNHDARLDNEPPTEFSGDGRAWAERSTDLAIWTELHLINRLDTYVRYSKCNTPDVASYRLLDADKNSIALTRKDLCSHFEANEGNRVGAYAYDEFGMSKWMCIDIDAHDGTLTDNWYIAVDLCESLESIGLKFILEHTNGFYGFHIWVLFETAIPFLEAQAIGNYVLEENNQGRLPEELIKLEIFPKGSKQQPFGVPVRIFGHHYKHINWHSHFCNWETNEWLSGPEAIDYVLDQFGNYVPAIPEAARKCSYQNPVQRSETGEYVNNGIDKYSGYKGAINTLDIVKLSAGLLTGHVSGSKYEINCPWESEHTADTGGTCVMEANEEYPAPSFKCLHSHCSNRTLIDYLSKFDKDVVNAHCSEMKTIKLAEDVDEKLAALFPTGDKKSLPAGMILSDFDPGDDDGDKKEQRVIGTRANNHNPSNTYGFIGIKDIRETSKANPVTWFVHGWLMKGALAMLAAHSFAGKSQFLADLAPAIANGLPIFGMDVRKTPVLMIDVENHESVIDARISDLKLDNSNDHIYWISKASLRGKLPLDTDAMREIITQFYAATGFTECIIFCDTLRSLFQIDETDSKQINDLFYPLQQLAQEMGVCLVLLNHRPKSNASYSGHNSMMAALDMFMMYEREGKRDSTLKMEGTRLYQPDDIFLRFDPATSTLGIRAATTPSDKMEAVIVAAVKRHPGHSQTELVQEILATWTVVGKEVKPGKDKIKQGLLDAVDAEKILVEKNSKGHSYHPVVE